MGYVICVIASSTISYLICLKMFEKSIKASLEFTTDRITEVIQVSADWIKEDRERMNQIVKDINKYYGGISEDEESNELVYPPGTGE